MKKFFVFLLFFIFSQKTLSSTALTAITSGPVTLISITPDIETISAQIALISVDPELNMTIRHTDVLRGHISGGHWSALEHGYMTLKIKTSRAISIQLFRHRSFTFQQFSQKYADTIKTIGEMLPIPDLRSYQNIPPEEIEKLKNEIREHFTQALDLYKKLIAARIKTECARFVLPEITQTVVCMTGSIRSWIHFIERCSRSDSQPEMHEIVAGCKAIFKQMMPNISEYLKQTRSEWGWNS